MELIKRIIEKANCYSIQFNPSIQKYELKYHAGFDGYVSIEAHYYYYQFDYLYLFFQNKEGKLSIVNSSFNSTDELNAWAQAVIDSGVLDD